MAGLADRSAGKRLGPGRLSLADRVRDYLREHPYDGPQIESSDMIIDGQDMRLIGEPPQYTFITAVLLDDPPFGVFSFDEGVLTVNLLPKAIRYRVLYWAEYDSIALERID